MIKTFVCRKVISFHSTAVLPVYAPFLDTAHELTAFNSLLTDDTIFTELAPRPFHSISCNVRLLCDPPGNHASQWNGEYTVKYGLNPREILTQITIQKFSITIPVLSFVEEQYWKS